MIFFCKQISLFSVVLFPSGLDVMEDDVEVDATACVAAVHVQISCKTEAKRLSITDFLKFMLLFNCLGPLVNHLTFHQVSIIPPEDQLPVTLRKRQFTLDDCEICRK